MPPTAYASPQTPCKACPPTILPTSPRHHPAIILNVSRQASTRWVPDTVRRPKWVASRPFSSQRRASTTQIRRFLICRSGHPSRHVVFLHPYPRTNCNALSEAYLTSDTEGMAEGLDILKQMAISEHQTTRCLAVQVPPEAARHLAVLSLLLTEMPESQALGNLCRHIPATVLTHGTRQAGMRFRSRNDEGQCIASPRSCMTLAC